MLESAAQWLTRVADTVCGLPMFLVLIGGGLFLFLAGGAVSIRRLPRALAELRSSRSGGQGQISSAQALAGVVSATVGMGNIAGVAIALVTGGPGAIFWMWVSAIVGMSTKYHEGVLAIKYRGTTDTGEPAGGTMHIIDRALGPRWHWLATAFAVAGMFGTLCIMNANQLTEAVATVVSPEGASSLRLRLIIGVAIAAVVAAVVLGGIKRIARVASWLVPFMVGAYFLMVLYIILTRLPDVPGVISSIFSEAFSLRAGWGALIGVAIIGARRAAFVNDAGVGTATIMHGASRNDEPVREGLIAMLGPAIDSGLVCSLTALAILLGTDLSAVEGVKGLSIALDAFGSCIPGGHMMLMVVVTCFAISSMFSYSFYGTRCAAYLVGERRARLYTYIFIATLVVFAVLPVTAAVSLCDLFYALMVFPTMFTVLALSGRVRAETRRYFSALPDSPASSSPSLTAIEES